MFGVTMERYSDQRSELKDIYYIRRNNLLKCKKQALRIDTAGTSYGDEYDSGIDDIRGQCGRSSKLLRGSWISRWSYPSGRFIRVACDSLRVNLL